MPAKKTTKTTIEKTATKAATATTAKKTVTKKTTRKKPKKATNKKPAVVETVDEKKYNTAVNSLIKEYKKIKAIKYSELSEKIAEPFSLDADGMDKLMQKVEDAGIGIVDENGEPDSRALKQTSNKVSKK